MKRVLAIVLFASLAACNRGSGPALEDNVIAGDGKEDTGLAASQIAPKLAPMYAFLRDDKNLVTELGPEGTTATHVKKRVKVVKYTDFGQAVEAAVKPIAQHYYVDLANGKSKKAATLADLLSVGDMYVGVKAGYGEEAYIDRLVAEGKRADARSLATTLLPEAALVNADQASTTSTGNWIVVLGDMESGQAIVMTIEYWVE